MGRLDRCHTEEATKAWHGQGMQKDNKTSNSYIQTTIDRYHSHIVLCVRTFRTLEGPHPSGGLEIHHWVLMVEMSKDAWSS